MSGHQRVDAGRLSIVDGVRRNFEPYLSRDRPFTLGTLFIRAPDSVRAMYADPRSSTTSSISDIFGLPIALTSLTVTTKSLALSDISQLRMGSCGALMTL